LYNGEKIAFCPMCGEKLNRLPVELIEVAQPIIEWLAANYDPHTAIIIELGSIRVVRDEIGVTMPTKNGA
jgi:hypothetical protein